MPQAVVQLQALDGTWENCGVDRVNGIAPENLRADADAWGSKGCTFDLRRDPSAVWPDISAFTPVKVIVDGSTVWEGRVSETPSRDGAEQVMAVACEGWQAHLDDDLADAFWVHARLGDWVDAKSMIGVTLAGTHRWIAGASVSGGLITFPRGMPFVTGSNAAGILLDLGPSRTFTDISVDWESSNNNGAITAVAAGTNDSMLMIGTDAFTFTLASGASGTTSGTVGASRYAVIYCKFSAGTSTITDECWLRVKAVRVFSSGSYRSGSTSVLKASTVISDALDKTTPLLSTDRSGITATSFSIPEFAPPEPRTPREMWSAVNAYHGWLSKIDIGRRPVFQAQPSRPKYEVGDWSAVEVQDSSQNSGQDIYNRVIVTGRDPVGQPVSASRLAGQITGAAVTRIGVPTLANPSFDVDTSSWTPTGTSFVLTRDTTTYDSSPAGLLGSRNLSAGNTLDWTISANWTGTFVKDRAYVLTFWGGWSVPAVKLTIGGQEIWARTYDQDAGANLARSVSWVPTQTLTNPTMTFGGTVPSQSYLQLVRVWLDSFVMSQAEATLPDRRRFRRTKQLAVNSTLPTDGVAAAQIGDSWLSAHSTTPFRGQITLTGPNALRNRLSGQPVPLAELLTNTGELIYFADRPDPDTGAAGRNGRIAGVSYDPAADAATVTLDNTRNDLDFLLSRLAVVQGSN